MNGIVGKDIGDAMVKEESSDTGLGVEIHGKDSLEDENQEAEEYLEDFEYGEQYQLKLRNHFRCSYHCQAWSEIKCCN